MMHLWEPVFLGKGVVAGDFGGRVLAGCSMKCFPTKATCTFDDLELNFDFDD
ncbi:hypothetical protein GA0071314_2577 [Halomonas sp. HL-93]|nr:hypothetical protein GA0071314_2577 [Halomonas sp. HL-93]